MNLRSLCGYGRGGGSCYEIVPIPSRVRIGTLENAKTKRKRRDDVARGWRRTTQGDSFCGGGDVLAGVGTREGRDAARNEMQMRPRWQHETEGGSWRMDAARRGGALRPPAAGRRPPEGCQQKKAERRHGFLKQRRRLDAAPVRR